MGYPPGISTSPVSTRTPGPGKIVRSRTCLTLGPVARAPSDQVDVLNLTDTKAVVMLMKIINRPCVWILAALPAALLAALVVAVPHC
jgi:hypothetical protein